MSGINKVVQIKWTKVEEVATGNITSNTVEVNALLPTLDNMEYIPE